MFQRNPKKRKMSWTARNVSAKRSKVAVRRRFKLRRRRPFRTNKYKNPPKKGLRFRNKVLDAITKTVPTSMDITGFNFSIGPGPTDNAQDKFFVVGNSYDGPSFRRIFEQIPILERATRSIWCGAYKYQCRITNNSDHDMHLRLFRCGIKNDIDGGELTNLYTPALFHQWIKDGFDDQRYPTNVQYRDMNLKFNSNTNYHLRPRMIKNVVLKPGRSVTTSAGSKRYHNQKFEPIDDPGVLLWRRYSKLWFVQATPVLGHTVLTDNANIPPFSQINSPLTTTVWRLDVDWKTHHYFKLLPTQQYGVIIDNYTPPNDVISGTVVHTTGDSIHYGSVAVPH